MPAQSPPRKSHSWGAAHFQLELSQAAPSGAHTGGASAPGVCGRLQARGHRRRAGRKGRPPRAERP